MKKFLEREKVFIYDADVLKKHNVRYHLDLGDYSGTSGHPIFMLLSNPTSIPMCTITWTTSEKALPAR